MLLKTVLPDEFILSQKDCVPYINKYGNPINMDRFRSSLIEYYDLLCFINGKRRIAKLNFPRLMGINIHVVLDKLKILVLAQNKGLLFIKLDKQCNNNQLLLFIKKKDIFHIILYIAIWQNYTFSKDMPLQKTGDLKSRSKYIRKKTGDLAYHKFDYEHIDDYFLAAAKYHLLLGYLFGYNKTIIKGRIKRLYIDQIYYKNIENKLSAEHLYDLKYINAEFHKDMSEKKKFEKMYNKIIKKSISFLKIFIKKYTKKYEKKITNEIYLNIQNLKSCLNINSLIDSYIDPRFDTDYLKKEVAKFRIKINQS